MPCRVSASWRRLREPNHCQRECRRGGGCREGCRKCAKAAETYLRRGDDSGFGTRRIGHCLRNGELAAEIGKANGADSLC